MWLTHTNVRDYTCGMALLFERFFFEMAKAMMDCMHISKFVLGFTEKEREQRKVSAQK